jgi:hypothetical protein
MICEYCYSEKNVTEHHLVPRAFARRMLKKDRPAVSIMMLCRNHHDILHNLASIRELAKKFNTPEKVIELLKSSELILN